MEDKNKEVVEKTTEQPIEEVVNKKEEKQLRNKKGQFKSKVKVEDDGVIKIDLSKPIPTKEEVVKEKENVVKEPEVKEEIKEEAQEDVPVIEEVTVEDLKEPKKVEEATIKLKLLKNQYLKIFKNW